MSTRFDFTQWLDTKPGDEKYDYMRCDGGCAVGQFMKEVHDEKWDFNRYNQYIASIFGFSPKGGLYDLQNSTTFGELRTKLRELEPA